MLARIVSLIIASGLSVIAVATGPYATVTGIARAQPGQNARPGSVDVTFDREICFAATGTSSSSFNPLWARGISQARIEGNVVSIIVDTHPASDCLRSRRVTIMLPSLQPGNYTVRVAALERRLTGTRYANTLVGPWASASLVQPFEPVVGTPVPVYNLQLASATALTTQDLGTYEYSPISATEQNLWQPVFYAWPFFLSMMMESWSSDQQRVFELSYSVSEPTDLRMFYTIDLAERDRLVASGAFTESSRQLAFLAVPPIGGACRAGTEPIFRAFDAKRIAHRYVPLNTYLALQANGLRGEGVAFCVPPSPANGNSWAPN